MEDVKKSRIAGVNSRLEFIFCLPNWRHDQRLRFGNLEIIGPLDSSLTNANWQNCLIEGKPKKGRWSIWWHFRGILGIKKWFNRSRPPLMIWKGPNDRRTLNTAHSLYNRQYYTSLPAGKVYEKEYLLAYKSDELISIERLFGIMPSANIKCLKD